MKSLIVLFLCFCVLKTSLQDADECDEDNCKGPSCRCSSVKKPIENPPQLVSLTFDEAVVDNLFVSFWQPLLFERTNPDGNPIGATFFVPHEYTDYSRVQDLYLNGFEIAVNSITKNGSAEYWRTADVSVLEKEFGGQRIIISHFANIPREEIVGVRTPQLELQGDNSIAAYVNSELVYDSSWTSRSTARMFPYSLDYKSSQECRTGTTCPKESYKNFWILPIIDLQGTDSEGNSIECTSLVTCNEKGSAEEIADWLMRQIEKSSEGNRAPQTIMVSSAWFRFTNNSYEGFEKFLDRLRNDNVYLVSQRQVYEWIRNPVSEDQFETITYSREAECTKFSCPLLNTEGNIRYMTSCVPCPEVYPWIGNPLGLSDPDEPTTRPPPPPTTPPPTPSPTEAPDDS